MAPDEDFLESYNDDSDFNDILFYTPKIIQHIDDSEIIKEIFKRFPKLGEANKSKDEKEERKVFLEFLQQKILIDDLLKTYGLTIVDLIKLFYRHFSYLFNTVTYSNKIKTIIEKNGYSTAEK